MKTKLSAMNVKGLKAVDAKGAPVAQADHFDTILAGFGLRVTRAGVRAFFCMYRVDGKLRRDTLGRYDPEAKGGEPGSLAWARERARAMLAAVQAGRDPRQARDDERRENERRRSETYAAAVESFIDTWAKAKKGNRTWAEQKRLLLRASPDWHARPVAEIARRDVHAALDGYMADGKPYAANRTYAALKTFFRWAEGRDLVTVNPMEGVEKPFDGEKSRERHWTDDEVKALWGAADAIGGAKGGYLKTLILLGQRRNEIAEMQWGQLDADTWTLPGGQTKNKRAHVFPLAPLAKRIVTSQKRIEGCPYVFPGRFIDRPMAGWAKFQTLVREKSGIADFTFHAARHTLATRLDALGVAPHVKVACLNHTPQGVTAGYSHYRYIDEQREAFEAWAGKVAEIVASKDVAVLR